MMPKIIGLGQMSLIDLNDAIISGTAPSNPAIGTLWVDETKTPKQIKKWDGTVWQVIGEIMDEGTGATIIDIEETLGNMANDNIIDFQERQVIKDKLTEIIGFVIADSTTTLPTTATLDSSAKGDFYMVRKSALNAGILSTDALYVAVATQYNNLKSYLEGLTPIDPWDLRNADTTITVVKGTFRDKWLQYYLAVDALATATADKLKKNVDDIKVGGTNIARNGDFSIPLNESLWASEMHNGDVTEVIDISAEAPPHQKALHIKNNTAKNGGYADADLFTGESANATVGKDITISFWIKYSGITQGTQTWMTGRFGELVVEGETSTGTKVYSYMQNMNVTGTNATWQKKEFTYRVSLPASAIKVTKISLKHQLETCVGEFWTTGIKAEMGNKATDWSQSPFDIQARLVNVEFKITDDQITSRVTAHEKFNLALKARADGKGFNFVDGVQGWKTNHALTNNLSATIVNEGQYGKSLQLVGEQWVFFGQPIPVDTSKIYKVKLRVKQSVNPTTAGTSKVYAGVACYDVNKAPLTASSFGMHRYCAVASTDITVADGWKEFAGQISGEGDEGYGQFIANTKYVVPMFVVNYTGGTGTTLVNECSIEDVSDLSMLGDKVSTVEQKITPSGISTVIEESTFYQNYTSEMSSKADTSTLGSYAKTTDVNDAIDKIDVEGTVASTIEAMAENEESKLRTKFTTKGELEETSKNITAKFSATGGMNLLKNSIGFSDFITKAIADIGNQQNWFIQGTQSRARRVQNTALDTLGFGSGLEITPLASTTVSIDQYVNVVPNKEYTLSWYINKVNESVSSGSLEIFAYEYGTTTKIPMTYEDGVTTGTGYWYSHDKVTNGYEVGYMRFKPTTSKVHLRIYGSAETSAIITGLMFSIGDVPLQWSLATGENYNTNVRLDINGIRVSQLNENKTEIGYTQITPDEFAGYYDSDGDGIFEKVFYLNGDETVTKKIRALNEITMGTIKIIKVEAGGNMGWAFVPITSE